MRILQIIDGLHSGGKERQLLELIKGLKKVKGVDVEVVILSEDINYDYVYDLKINLNIIKRKRKKDFTVFKKVYNICKIFKPEIIHSWELMCSVYALPIARILNVKFINGMIRYSPSNFSIVDSKWYLMTKASFILSDYILSNSYAGLRSYKVLNYKSLCIHNGFDFERINSLNDIELVKARYNINTKYVVGMVARFERRKDYPMYINSAMNILKYRDDVTFLAVGDGETLDSCKRLVPLKYGKYLRFLGKQNDIESLINIFNIGVLISYEEGISNSIMEYMALEKPVIALNHGGNDEIVIDNVTGFIIEKNDLNGLIEKIDLLLNNKNMATEMGKAGEKRIRESFNLEKMTEAHIQLYKKCLS